MKTFLIHADPYPFDILFHYGSYKSLLKNIKNYDISKKDFKSLEKDINAKAKSFCWKFNGGQHLVWSKEVPKTNVDISVMIHEIFHAVSDIMGDVGILHETKGSNEAFAYLLENITKQALDNIK